MVQKKKAIKVACQADCFYSLTPAKQVVYIHLFKVT